MTSVEFRRLRRRSTCTLHEFAARLGCHWTSVARYESGRRAVPEMIAYKALLLVLPMPDPKTRRRRRKAIAGGGADATPPPARAPTVHKRGKKPASLGRGRK